jgi:hypothetical protein
MEKVVEPKENVAKQALRGHEVQRSKRCEEQCAAERRYAQNERRMQRVERL